MSSGYRYRFVIIIYLIDAPPSTEIIWPVIKDARSDKRNETNSPISSGSPILWKRDDFSSIFLAFGSALKYSLTPGVFIVPGDTALTLILFLAISFATDWVKLFTAALLAAYIELNAYPFIAELEEIFTTEAEIACCFKNLISAWRHFHKEVKVKSSVAWTSSRE